MKNRIFQDATGFKVRVVHETPNTVVAAPTAGGFEIRMGKLLFNAVYSPVDDSPHWRKSRFTLANPYVVEGYTDGKEWNGWACPAFTFEQGMALLPMLQLVYGEDFFSEIADPGTRYYPFHIEVEGEILKVYRIGDGWIWDEVEVECSVPVWISEPIKTAGSARGFIEALFYEGRLYHLEDDPAEIISSATGMRMFSDQEAAHLRRRAVECFQHLEDPLGVCCELAGLVPPEDEGDYLDHAELVKRVNAYPLLVGIVQSYVEDDENNDMDGTYLHRSAVDLLSKLGEIE